MASHMKKGPAEDKVEPTRYWGGPRSIGALLPAVTRPAFRKHAPAAASLLSDWPAIVGPALARTTQPQRLSAGTLTLGCAGPVALELQHLVGPLLERINAHLGGPVVQRVRFMQQTVLPQSGAAPTRRVRLDPVVIDGMPDGALRDALAALGAEVLADHA